MNQENKLDKIHAAVTANGWLQIFTVFTRVLLAAGFIPPSIVKILNRPFTVMPDSHPVGHYFNALYNTGFYYQFIGWTQLIAALLLLFPRTAHLGALMFFPIILNIAVLTNSVGFVGTNYITASMLLAAIYLLAWEYDRVKLFFTIKRRDKTQIFRKEFLWLPAFFAVGGAAAATLFVTYGVGNLHRNSSRTFVILTALGFVFGLVCCAHHRFMKTSEIKNLS